MKNKYTQGITQDGLTPGQWKVLRVVAQFTDNNTGECFPSLGTIAAAADVARSTVQLAIDDLCEMGRLEVVGKRPTKHGSVNVYRVILNHTDNHTDAVNHTDTDNHTDPPKSASTIPMPVGMVQAQQNRSVSTNHTDLTNHTDRYLTDQVGSKFVTDSPETGKNKPNPQPLISTDPLSPYVDRVVKRFARYKTPGRDAETFAREILLDKMFIGDKPEDHKTFLPAQEATIGDLATRHLIDIIGWIFEINAYDQGQRAFRWAERTYTMKNLRDHLLKEQSRLFAAYADWCHEKQCGYSLGTIGEAEFVEYNNKINQRIARYKAARD